jgi:hypothetical protein
LQLAISYVYIPILIYWGIPISFMGIVGNLIFAPWLIIFLFISTLLFVTQLMHIPNLWLAQLLDLLCAWWLKLLTMGSPTWLIGFPCPGIWALILMVATGVAIIYATNRRSMATQLLWLTAGLCFWLVGIKYYAPLPSAITIPHRAAMVTIQRTDDTLTLVFPRTTIRQNSFARWYQMVVRPACYRAFGSSNLGAIKLVNPTVHAITVLQELKDKLGYQQLIVTK